MSSLILSGWNFFLSMLMVVILGVAQSFGSWISKENTRIASGVTCRFADAEVVDRGVQLNLDCGGRKAYLYDSSVVVNYLKNPGPLTCVLYQSGRAKCVRTTN